MISAQPLMDFTQLPGPKAWPLLGNLLQIDLHRLHLILEEWADCYGEMYRFKLARKPAVVVSRLESIQQILRERPHLYRRVEAVERISHELGSHGVFAAEGEQWRRQRAVTMHAFKPENLRRFFPTLRNTTQRLERRWRNTADLGLPFVVDKDWMRFTVDVTTQFAFGYDINLLENESDEFQLNLENQLPGFNRRAHAPFPYWHYIKLPADRQLEKSLAAIKNTIAGFIEQTRERLAQQPDRQDHPANFLEALLMNRDDNGQLLSDDEIRGNVLTILMAGEDTTAHTLSWLLHLIALHPEIQAKLQCEVDNVLGADTIPPDLSCLDNLPYLEAVAQETLRLKNVAPMLYVEPLEDVVVNGVSIPKGTMMILLGRQPALQDENFNEARRFNPDRWLEMSGADCPHNRGAFLPFGAGPRFCPGRGLALLEIKMAMAMVCRNFDVCSLDPSQSVREIFAFTMMPEDLQIVLQRRSESLNSVLQTPRNSVPATRLKK